MLRLLSRLLILITLFAVSASCGKAENPRSLWINYGQREINLVLVDFEPPPF